MCMLVWNKYIYILQGGLGGNSPQKKKHFLIKQIGFFSCIVRFFKCTSLLFGMAT